MTSRLYTVSGKWPFPLDMLRHDLAGPATDTDRDLITRMTGEASDPELGMNTVTIALRMEGGEPVGSRPGGRYVPNEARWKSFGWIVSGGGAEARPGGRAGPAPRRAADRGGSPPPLDGTQ